MSKKKLRISKMATIVHRENVFKCTQTKCIHDSSNESWIANLRYPSDWIVKFNNGTTIVCTGDISKGNCKYSKTTFNMHRKESYFEAVGFGSDKKTARYLTNTYAVYKLCINDIKTGEEHELFNLLLSVSGDKKIIMNYLHSLNVQYTFGCTNLGMLFDTLRFACYEYFSSLYIF